MSERDPVMPTLADADCLRVHRKRDLLNRDAAEAGLAPPIYGHPYVAEIVVNDGLGYDLESRQYLRIDGHAYRVREWRCDDQAEGYRYTLEPVMTRDEAMRGDVWWRAATPEPE